MTTVSHGDIPPMTPLGKLIACILMVFGIGFFALITGAVAQRFLATEIAEVGEEIDAAEAEMLEQTEALGRLLQTLEGPYVEARDIASRERIRRGRPKRASTLRPQSGPPRTDDDCQPTAAD
jgi:voltage-gated potassium channel